MKAVAGTALEDKLASKLKELLGGISWLREWRVEQIGGKPETPFDLVAKLPLLGREILLCVECKAEMRPSGFHNLAVRRVPSLGDTREVVPVLAMPFVSARMVELCKQHGWSWYDLAGNCHFDVPGAIYIERRGNEPLHRSPRPRANLSTPEAGRVVRALLAPENAGMRWTQRAMQAHFGPHPDIPGPSLGLVNKVVQHLRDEAFIEVKEEGGFQLRDPLRLLSSWQQAYRFDRHERVGYFTLLQGIRLREALAHLDIETGGLAAYAAFSAADFQAPHVRQPRTWIYVRRDFVSDFEALAEAKPVDSGENVVVLIPGDDGVFYTRDVVAVGDRRMRCTNLIQTYVDLFHCGGRGEEASAALLEQRLKPKWTAAGLL